MPGYQPRRDSAGRGRHPIGKGCVAVPRTQESGSVRRQGADRWSRHREGRSATVQAIERSSRLRHRRTVNARVLAVCVLNGTTWRVPRHNATDVFARWTLPELLIRQKNLWVQVKRTVRTRAARHA